MSAQPHVLIIGVTPQIYKALPALEGKALLTQIEYNVETLSEPLEPPPNLIICCAPTNGISILETAQVLRMNYAEAPIFFIGEIADGYNKKNMVKNGFTDVFLLPLDQETLKKSILDFLASLNKQEKSFRSVKLIDIQAGTKLDFDTHIYMPLNKKYVTFSHGGDQLSEDRAEKLAQHKITSVFVPQDQMQKFYEYTAARLKDLSTNQKMSETERRDKLQGAVRDLISGIFNGETVSAGSGKQVIEDCQKIVSTFILSSTKSDWYSKILSITSDTSNTYSHAANTSTFASLFSIALGIGNPEELALAGLLHDIGMAKVPIEIQNKRPEEWTPEEKAIYEKHPEHTIDIIKERKLIVSENVHKMILQHHEKFSGTGFPKQLSGKKILIEAQILSLADIFDELTAIIEGKAQISPADAFKSMKMTAASDPGNQAVDPDLLAKVGNLFLSEENKKIA